MEIVKIIGIAFVTVICSTLIKSVKPELAFAVTTAGTLVILLQIFGKMTEITAIFSKIADVKDAEWIADLARHGLIRASFIPSREQRELREITRYRL